MRVIGGRLGGRHFDAPAGRATRPTSDRVREGVASALDARDAFAGAHVLDLFAGSGGWAFEALSRGASDALLVDHDRRVTQLIARNAEQLGLSSLVTVLGVDLLDAGRSLIKRLPAAPNFTLVFVDPPYAEVSKVPALLETLTQTGRLAAGALLVLERASRDAAVAAPFLEAVASYRYGDTTVDLHRLNLLEASS